MKLWQGFSLSVGAAALLLAGLLVYQRRPDVVPSVTAVRPAQEVAYETADSAPVSDPRATADRVLAALQARDGAALAALVHPNGVRLSPSAYVDTATDQLLRPAEAATLWSDRAIRTWGTAEASGDPIELTPADYVSRYILDRDYRTAMVSVNENTNRGTTIDNSASIYPDATRIEYFVRGDDATDWSALRLVLIPIGHEWRLVGIIHDTWAP